MSGKNPYLVRVTESFSKTVIVWADNKTGATEAARSLCDAGDIDVTRNGYIGREVVCDGIASEPEKTDYQEYDAD